MFNATNSRFTYLPQLLIVVCMVITASILFSMGRPLICTCGTIKLWHGVVFSSENSQHIADWYTFSHITHGFLFYGIFWLIGKIRKRSYPISWLFLGAVLLESGWEILENTDMIINRYRSVTISLDYFGDSIINSIFDIIWMMLGFTVAYRFPALITIILALAMEIGVGLIIRDNLTINIIMLLYPLDWIKAWQTSGSANLMLN